VTTVDLSRNEFSSAVHKACVGVGSDPGLAADISAGCLDLQAAGVDSLTHLLPLLEQAQSLTASITPEPYAHSQNGYFTPKVVLLRNGASVMDHLCLATVTVEACEDFVLLAAMIHAGCTTLRRFARVISVGKGWANLDHAYLASAPHHLAGPITFRFIPVENDGDLVHPQIQERVIVAIQRWAALREAAAAVLVPADDATRLRDAGAGLNDND